MREEFKNVILYEPKVVAVEPTDPSYDEKEPNKVKKIVTVFRTVVKDGNLVAERQDYPYSQEIMDKLIAESKRIEGFETIKESEKIVVSYKGDDITWSFPMGKRASISDMLGEQRLYEDNKQITPAQKPIAPAPAAKPKGKLSVGKTIVITTGIIAGLLILKPLGMLIANNLTAPHKTSKEDTVTPGTKTSLIDAFTKDTPPKSTPEVTATPKPTKRPLAFDINNDTQRMEKARELCNDLKSLYNQDVNLQVAEDAVSMLNTRFDFEELTVAEASERMRVANNLVARGIIDNCLNAEKKMFPIEKYIADQDAADLIKADLDLSRGVVEQLAKEEAAYAGKRSDLSKHFSKDYITKHDKWLENARTRSGGIDFVTKNSALRRLDMQIVMQAGEKFIEPTDSINKEDSNHQDGDWIYDAYTLDKVVKGKPTSVLFLPTKYAEKKYYEQQGVKGGKHFTEEELKEAGAELVGIRGDLVTYYDNACKDFWGIALTDCTDYADYIAKTSNVK